MRDADGDQGSDCRQDVPLFGHRFVAVVPNFFGHLVVDLSLSLLLQRRNEGSSHDAEWKAGANECLLVARYFDHVPDPFPSACLT